MKLFQTFLFCFSISRSFDSRIVNERVPTEVDSTQQNLQTKTIVCCTFYHSKQLWFFHLLKWLIEITLFLSVQQIRYAKNQPENYYENNI